MFARLRLLRRRRLGPQALRRGNGPKKRRVGFGALHRRQPLPFLSRNRTRYTEQHSCRTPSKEPRARVSKSDYTHVSIFLMIYRDGTEGGERYQDTSGYREGVVRLVPSPQVGSRWCQRGHQALRSRVIPCLFYPSLTVSQECKDVKEKAKQLIPWLNRLKDNLSTVANEIDLEEVQRRAELSR